MKVIFLNQIPEVNNKYSFSLARGLQNNGVEVIVWGIKSDNYEAYLDVPYKNDFAAYSKVNNLVKKVICYYKSWKRILKYAMDNSFDIVHIQWYIFSPMDYFFIRRLQKKGIRVITTIHDLLPFDSKFYDEYFHKKIYRCSDGLITQAKDNIQQLYDKFGVKKEIFYIPHGHYMDYAESASREESLQQLGLPFDKKIILFFGQIKKVKGVDVLIDAMEEVIKQQDDVLCLIAGKVWKDDFEVYRKQIESLKLQQYMRCDIRFIEDDEIKYYFNAADIVTLPYRQIYQSGVALLAYAYEKPLVATSEGEFMNVVKNNETGLLVKSGDAKELAKAICWYLNHPEEAKSYGKCGKKDLLVRLDWNNIAKQVFDVYKKSMER